MDNKSLLYGVIGLLLGAGLTTYVASNAVNTSNANMMRMMGINQGMMMEEQEAGGMMGMESSMDDMMMALSDKTGDDFDRAFMESMMVHHQGAIEMARKAQMMAKHDEIKSMADDIIEAQTSEINMMRSWQQTWGY